MNRIQHLAERLRPLLLQLRGPMLRGGALLLVMGLIPLLGFCRKPEPAPSPAVSDVFTIYDESTGDTLTVSDRDFLIPATVCEMSPLWEPEALKAQAVAAYTYYDYHRAQRRAAGNTEDPDLTCRSASWLRYTTDAQLRRRWGSAYDDYMTRLTAIRDEVLGQRLVYQGQRVLSTYFAVSAGRTESCADIWGGGQPYLIPVDSPWDKQAPGYASAVTVSAADFRSALKSLKPDSDFSAAAQPLLGPATRTGSGTVLTMELGGQVFTGAQLRSLFGLRSACFQLTAESDSFCFQVQGYGHGVGMSQTGANALAANGAGYREILAHYYPGTDIFCGTVG